MYEDTSASAGYKYYYSCVVVMWRDIKTGLVRYYAIIFKVWI